MNVADLAKGELDASGNTLSFFYARKPPEYAVYHTVERVVVHYADSVSKADEQRKSLAQLAPLRGEINGLLDSWRKDKWYFLNFKSVDGAKLRERAARYDRRIADALVVALEGDLTGAGALLQAIKDDVLDKRVGTSRFEYLIMALTVTAVFSVLSVVVSWLPCSAANPLCFEKATDLWRGAIAGALGSFFSIALAIRGRTILTDLHRVSNLTDAALRVAIGIIAATVLVALILTKFVRISFGDSSPDNADPLYVAVVGFIAGFAERLVPDLLAKAEARTGEDPVLRKPEPEPAKPDKPQAGNSQQAAGASQPAAASDPLPEQAREDACVSDIPLGDNEITPDESLPVASGGVVREPRDSAV